MKLLFITVFLFTFFAFDQIEDHHGDLAGRRVVITKTTTEVPVGAMFVIGDYPNRKWLSFTGLENPYYFDIHYSSRVEFQNGSYYVYFGEDQRNLMAFKIVRR